MTWFPPGAPRLFGAPATRHLDWFMTYIPIGARYASEWVLGTDVAGVAELVYSGERGILFFCSSVHLPTHTHLLPRPQSWYPLNNHKGSSAPIHYIDQPRVCMTIPTPSDLDYACLEQRSLKFFLRLLTAFAFRTCFGWRFFLFCRYLTPAT